MIKALGRIVPLVISIIIDQFRRPREKVKKVEVVNVKYDVNKKAS